MNYQPVARSAGVRCTLGLEAGLHRLALSRVGIKRLRELVGGLKGGRFRARSTALSDSGSSAEQRGSRLLRRGGSWSFSGNAGPPGITAISLAGGGLRIAAMQKGEVSFWQHVSLPPGLVRQGVVADPEAFAACLRETLDRCVLPRKLSWALPGTVGTARLLSVPNANARDMNSLVAREAAMAMAISPEDCHLHWQAIGRGQVFALAVHRAAVDNLALACTQAKAEVRAVDLRPLALALAIGAQEAVIADVEANSIDILIVAQGVPVAMRSLILSDDALDAVYARAKLVEELAISLQLYDKTNPEMPLARSAPVYLSGELSDDDLAGKIAFLTKHPTVQPDAPFACPPGLPAAKFLANLGLMMKR